MEMIQGGVCAAKGFTAAGIHAGVKAGSNPNKNDLALILSEAECTAAAMYTSNRVKCAPIYVTMAHLEDGTAWGVIVNSGNANACAPLSHEHAEEMCEAAAKATGRTARDFIVGSTGVIGQEINIKAIVDAVPQLTAQLSKDGSDAAATAIMTTDTKKKEYAVQVELGGKLVTLGAICKGSGMIHPNMGTMLCFLTSDCAITSDMLNAALHEVVPRTFNRVTVDGDTSTNDTCAILCNGLAGNALIEWKDTNYTAFKAALTEVLTYMARAMAADGEGASRLITCTVHGSRSEEVAERLSKSVVGSSLVKAAMFGADANWGRILCAMGYSKAPFRPERVDVKFRSCAGEILVCEGGSQVLFDEDKAKEILSQDEVIIDVNVNEGNASATCWGCDLTYDYVKINGDYRT
ncbi:MAG: bifunctional glutamate N-acetyltransferase/amino-acid acetyltransferase ArgJ [Oscillospiraceae bacterium]|nr:bifunctional glutamate N-acetyltransferase/amino-acid acetyltransferase ArgJ [Oscillospiraceae bacterium]